MTVFDRLHRQRARVATADAERLEVGAQREGDQYVVAPVGVVDEATVRHLEDELRRVEASDVHEIVVDLRGVLFMDAAGIRVLLDAGARSRARSTRLVLLRGTDSVQRRLEWSGLTTLLPCVDPDAEGSPGGA